MNENLVVELEKNGVVTSTFRKLSPDKKNIVYNSSIRAFGRDSFDRVALDTIADAAGISKGSLFQYFENKENLLEFTGYIFLDEYSSYWKKYFETETAIRVVDRIRNYIFDSINQWKNRTAEFAFLQKQLNENPDTLAAEFINRINEYNRRMISTIIERGIETGELRGDISSAYMTLIIQGLLEKILRIYSHKFHGRINESRLRADIDKYTRIIFEGISG